MANPYTNDSIQMIQYREDGTVTDGFKRYKVNCNYIEVPFELRFRIKDAWKIGVGFKVGYNVTPVFLPGEFQGQKSLLGYNPWGRKKLDTTERLTRYITYSMVWVHH